jgi:hypothetical protein
MARQLIPNSKLPQRYGSTREAVYRWKQDPELNFPKAALVINGRSFYDEEDLLAWEDSHRVEFAA